MAIQHTPPALTPVHDEAPAIITDHAFVPRAEWWSLCRCCSLAEAAHQRTTLTGNEHIHYYSDDNPDDD